MALINGSGSSALHPPQWETATAAPGEMRNLSTRRCSHCGAPNQRLVCGYCRTDLTPPRYIVCSGAPGGVIVGGGINPATVAAAKRLGLGR